MQRYVTALLAAVLAAALFDSAPVRAQRGGGAGPSGPAPLSTQKGKEYTLEKWADGVYLATGGTGSQDCVVVTDQGVLLFDTGTTPASARAVSEDIKLITDKPIRTVVNSHFHYDHAFGNGAFGPDVEIIGHRYTKTAIQTFDTLHREPFLSWINRNTEAQVESLTKQIAAETNPQRKAALETQRATTQRDIERAKEIKPIPPTVTFESNMVLKKGGREIRLLHLGRGHTGGDVVMFLPKERIVCSGDLIEGGISYLGDGFFDEWVKTLEALKQLDFAVVLPGHGRPFVEKSHITALQTYLADLVKQVEALRSQGLPPEEALQRLDLSAHEKDWPPRMRGVDIRSMRRIYAWLEERAAR